MATKKTSDKVEIIENDVTEPDTPKGEVVDGVYTEQVELTNGRSIDVGVIVDQDKLPATYGSLLAEGNAPALVVAQCTTRTRRMLDLAGATLQDLNEVVSPVIQRAHDAAE